MKIMFHIKFYCQNNLMHNVCDRLFTPKGYMILSKLLFTCFGVGFVNNKCSDRCRELQLFALFGNNDRQTHRPTMDTKREEGKEGQI